MSRKYRVEKQIISIYGLWRDKQKDYKNFVTVSFYENLVRYIYEHTGHFIHCIHLLSRRSLTYAARLQQILSFMIMNQFPTAPRTLRT